MADIYASAREALEGVEVEGAVIAVGGFGLCGVPFDLIDALHETRACDLTIVSNNMGVDGQGLGRLIEGRQVRKVIASYVGENRRFARDYLDGKLEVEFTPQGTLAERLRAGGAGVPAFYTASGVGTPVAEGKSVSDFDGRTFLLERGIVADIGLLHAWHADRSGNLDYHATARNFNPLIAAASRLALAEVEHLHEHPLDPDQVVTPGIYVDRVVTAQPRVKPIENRTVLAAASAGTEEKN